MGKSATSPCCFPIPGLSSYCHLRKYYPRESSQVAGRQGQRNLQHSSLDDSERLDEVPAVTKAGALQSRGFVFICSQKTAPCSFSKRKKKKKKELRMAKEAGAKNLQNLAPGEHGQAFREKPKEMPHCLLQTCK